MDAWRYASAMRKILLLLAALLPISCASELSLQQKNVTKLGANNFQPGDTQFDPADRIAINDVIDAYGIHWDNNDLESYLDLFSDDAVGVTYRPNGEKVEVKIKTEYSNTAKERMEYFESNAMQRRKMMANKLFIDLNDNYAHLHQYMTLLTTNNNLETEIVSSVLYVFKLKKINGSWKIAYREVKKTDAKLDLQFK